MKKKLMAAMLSIMMSTCMIAPAMVNAAGTDTVYVTQTGTKYHDPTCRTIRSSKNLTAMTINQAAAAGYTACKICKPGAPDSTAKTNTSSKPAAAKKAGNTKAKAAQPTAAATSAAAKAGGITAEEAVNDAFALYVQSGLDANAAMAKVQGVLPQISANPSNYQAIVQKDLGQQAAPASTGATAQQLVQQMYASLIAQGFSSDQAMAQINAQLPAIQAQAAR